MWFLGQVLIDSVLIRKVTKLFIKINIENISQTCYEVSSTVDVH